MQTDETETLQQPHLSDQHWHARLRLRFAQPSGKTVMVDNSHFGPLRVQRTFKVEDGSRHVYILHPPGGYVAGDNISIDVNTADAAHAVATSPGAAKFYRCETNSPKQSQQLNLNVEDNSFLEWLPMESIFYQGANSQLTTNINLSARASFLGWDIACLGRTASGESFSKGRLRQVLSLTREGVLLHRERLSLTPDDVIHQHAWGLNGQSVFGTLIAAFTTETNKTICDVGSTRSFEDDDGLLETTSRVRERLLGFEDAPSWSTTCKSGLLMVRYLGSRSETCKVGFNLIRDMLVTTFRNTKPVKPRIWAT